jgi:hypothetical protein
MDVEVELLDEDAPITGPTLVDDLQESCVNLSPIQVGLSEDIGQVLLLVNGGQGTANRHR